MALLGTASYGGSRLGDYVCMWANTSPYGGLVALGVADDGSFIGCHDLNAEQLNQIEKIQKVFCPDAATQAKRVPVNLGSGDSSFVVLIRVQYNESTVVKTTKGKAFVRKGDSKFELSAEEIRELRADKGEVSFEQQDCSLSWPSDYDTKAIVQFCSRVKQSRGYREDQGEVSVLAHRRLGKKVKGSFVPNYACALLFAGDPIACVPGCKIRFQRFEGEQEGTGEGYNAVKDLILEGVVPQLIYQIEQILDSQLRTFSPLDAKGKFYPVAEYPKPAWYEAIVNACVHRSYGDGLRNMPIFVKMFDDRLVIESPGPFPPFVTPDNIYTMHQPRNPQLMDAMYYMEYVKCANEGTRRIRDSMAKMKLPYPDFKQSEIGHSIVRVTLRNNIELRRAWIDQDVSKIVSEAIAADLSENEKRALNYAAEHGRITISDAQKLLDMTWHSARKTLIGLAERRVFQYVRFKPYDKNQRDPQAFFRLRSPAPLPVGSFEQVVQGL